MIEINEALLRLAASPEPGTHIGPAPYRGGQVESFSMLGNDGRYWRVAGGEYTGQMERPGPGPVFSRDGEIWIESASEILARVDATILRPDARPAMVRAFAALALESGCRNVCVFPARIPDVLDSWPAPATVISFPHGADGVRSKQLQIEAAVVAGAGEIDLVADRSLIAACDWTGLEEELAELRRVSEVPVKVILETGQMTLDDVPEATRAVENSGCEYAKTSTGMVPEGASIEAVEAMHQSCPDLGIKASGGIRTREAAGAMIRAGADVIGASDPQGLVI